MNLTKHALSEIKWRNQRIDVIRETPVIDISYADKVAFDIEIKALAVGIKIHKQYLKMFQEGE